MQHDLRSRIWRATIERLLAGQQGYPSQLQWHPCGAKFALVAVARVLREAATEAAARLNLKAFALSKLQHLPR